jgi:hypothetical protein
MKKTSTVLIIMKKSLFKVSSKKQPIRKKQSLSFSTTLSNGKTGFLKKNSILLLLEE